MESFAQYSMVLSYMFAVALLLMHPMYYQVRVKGYLTHMIVLASVSRLATYWIFVQWLEWYWFATICALVIDTALQFLTYSLWKKEQRLITPFAKSLAKQIHCTTEPKNSFG